MINLQKYGIRPGSNSRPLDLQSNTFLQSDILSTALHSPVNQSQLTRHIYKPEHSNQAMRLYHFLFMLNSTEHKISTAHKLQNQAPRSRVKNSTTGPLRSRNLYFSLCCLLRAIEISSSVKLSMNSTGLNIKFQLLIKGNIMKNKNFVLRGYIFQIFPV